MTRKAIGRAFIQADKKDTTTINKEFLLKSGKKANFKLITISSNKIEKDTFIDDKINHRDQSALNESELKDIIVTIKNNQFFPVIGVKRKNGIEILDGSRRRMAAIFAKVDLEVLYTEDNLSMLDAKQLALEIQTAKEHNIRELGSWLLKIKNSKKIDNKTIAIEEGLSEAKVTRAIQSASVPSELINLFPVKSILTYRDYKILLKVSDNLTIKLKDFCYVVEEEKKYISNELVDDAYKLEILKIIKKESSLQLNEKKVEKVEVKPLWDFDSKDLFAKKKTKGRFVSYEFNRVSKKLHKKIEDAIVNVLNEELSK